MLLSSVSCVFGRFSTRLGALPVFTYGVLGRFNSVYAGRLNRASGVVPVAWRGVGRVRGAAVEPRGRVPLHFAGARVEHRGGEDREDLLRSRMARRAGICETPLLRNTRPAVANPSDDRKRCKPLLRGPAMKIGSPR